MDEDELKEEEDSWIWGYFGTFVSKFSARPIPNAVCDICNFRRMRRSMGSGPLHANASSCRWNGVEQISCERLIL